MKTLKTSLIGSIYNLGEAAQLIVSREIYLEILTHKKGEMDIDLLLSENFPYATPTGLTIKFKVKE